MTRRLSNYDLTGNQLLNALAQILATDPVSPVAGQFWYNSTSNHIKYYDGTQAVTLYRFASTNTASTGVLRDASGDIYVNKVFVAATTPSANNELASKGYVDSVVNGLSRKEPVRVATTANITLSGTQTIDGVAVIAGDRILVKEQTDPTENGVYVVAAGAWSRSIDADANAEVKSGLAVWVEEGTANGDTAWALSTNNPITIGSTSLTFAQISGGTGVTAGAGLTMTGNTIDVGTASATRIVVNANDIDLATTGVGAGTYTKVTVDTYGRVTAATEIITSNGILARTAANTYTNRTLTGTANRVVVTNGDGVSGNPTFDVGTDVYTVGGTDVAVADGGTGASTAAGARANLGATTKYAADFGDGSTNPIVITHNLNTRDVVVAFRTVASPYEAVEIDWEATSVNTITIRPALAPATNEYRVIIIG